MNKKFRVLLSAFLSVAIVANSVTVTAVADSEGIFFGPVLQDDEPAAAGWGDIEVTAAEEVTEDTYSGSTDALMEIVISRASATASEKAALIEEIEAGEAKGICINGMEWIIDSSLTLTISGTGDMSATDLPWQKYATVVEKIVVSDGITGISKQAFLAFVAVKNIEIGANVVAINDEAFYGCTVVESVVLNSTVLQTIGAGAFYDCAPLKDFSIPSTVTAIGDSAFAGCKKITSIVVPSGVQTIGKKVFYGCESVKTVEISEGVLVIDESAFAGCAALESIILPSTLTTINKEAFKGCASLLSSNGNIDTVEFPESVTYIGESAFVGCNAIKRLIIEGSVDKNAFLGCIGLTEINISGSAENPVEIHDYAFSGTSSLVAVTLENVKAIGSYAFSTSGIRNVTLPEGLLTIDNYAFSKTNLEKIVIPSSVKNVNMCAFKNCTALESFSIASSSASVIFANNVFENCTALSDINLEGIGTFGREMFKNCTAITEVTLPLSATASGEMVFSGCTNLTKATANEGVKVIGSKMFYNCPITEFIIPASVTSCASVFDSHNDIKKVICNASVVGAKAFYGCTALESITLNDTVEIGGYAFTGCTALETITLPESLTKIGMYAFQNCTGFEKIIIPDGVTVLETGLFSGCENLNDVVISGDGVITSIGDETFKNCVALTTIPISESLEKIGYGAFSGCTGIKNFVIPEGVTVINRQTFENCTALEKVELKGDITKIDNRAFYNCGEMKDFVIPENVTYIGSEAFMGCKYLDCKIPSGVTSIQSSAFQDCVNLGKENYIVLPSSLTVIPANVFRNCENLNKVVIGDNVTSIGAYAFAGCSSTKFDRITIPAKVSSVGNNAFDGCTNLQNVTFIDGEKSCSSIGQKAFYNCTSLSSITVPTTLSSINSSAFENCTSLKSILMPSGLKSLGTSAFKNCTSLETAVLSGSAITTLSGEAFYGCTSLTTVELPASVTSISTKAFYGCEKLNGFTIPGKVTTIGSNAFDGCSSLDLIVIPITVRSFGSQTFFNCPSLTSVIVLSMSTMPISTALFTSGSDLTIFCYEGSSAIQYAEKYGFDYKLLEGSDGVYIAILKQPQIADYEIGSMVELSVKAASEGKLSYKWYYKNPGAADFTEAASTENTYSFTLTEAKNGVVVYCEITSVSSDGETTIIAKTNEVTVAAIKTPEISSLEATSESVTLKWNSTASGLSYRVYRADSAGGKKTLLDTVTTTTYTDTTVEAGNTYYYYVTSYDSNLNAESKYSVVKTATISTVPTKTTATAGDQAVTLNWTKVNGSTSYKIYYYIDGSFKLAGSTTETSYTVNKLENGKKYGFVVSTCVNRVWSTYTVDDLVYAIPMYLEKPANVKPVSGGGNVTITWDAVKNATSYRVFRSDSLTGARTLLKVRTSLYYIDTEVDTGKTYYYWIMAYNANAGAKSAYSSSSKVTVTNDFAKDISIKSASVLSTSATLKWDIVPGATSYRIYRRNDDGSRKLLAAQSMTEFKDTGLTKGKVYKYEIRAYSKTTGALSYYSPIKQVRPMAAPTILSGNVKGKITWEKNAVATSYRVYRADSLTGAKKLLAPTTLLTYTDKTAEKGKTYYYFVAAYDNSTGTLSAYSQPKIIKIA